MRVVVIMELIRHVMRCEQGIIILLLLKINMVATRVFTKDWRNEDCWGMVKSRVHCGTLSSRIVHTTRFSVT
jgi:hypothetical protein